MRTTDPDRDGVSSVRLQKYLSSAGVCSRRQGERLILKARVRVNGEVVTELGTRVNPERDVVDVDGQPVILQKELVYIALNKPRGYVASCHQPGDKTVMALVDVPTRIYPVGRLDKDSTGLLILTNDGRLHHRLSHPSFDHEKAYEVTVSRPIAEGALGKMAMGMPMMGSKTRPAKIKRRSARRFQIVLKEGKNRQIRRMVRKVGNRVTDLKRTRVSNVRLGRLPTGQWRPLTKKERHELLRRIGSP